MGDVRKEQGVWRDLVVRAQHGDVEAFSILASQAIDRLYSVAYRILRDADRADDATQQALIAAWDHLDGLRDPDRFDAWTYRLVVNAAKREARREGSRRARIRLVTQPPAAEADPAADAGGRDELERAFRQLSPDHRAVLVLHHYADLPLTEIAEILGIPVGTVGSRLYHATRRLRGVLEADGRAALARGEAV